VQALITFPDDDVEDLHWRGGWAAHKNIKLVSVSSQVRRAPVPAVPVVHERDTVGLSMMPASATASVGAAAAAAAGDQGEC